MSTKFRAVPEHADPKRFPVSARSRELYVIRGEESAGAFAGYSRLFGGAMGGGRKLRSSIIEGERISQRPGDQRSSRPKDPRKKGDLPELRNEITDRGIVA